MNTVQPLTYPPAVQRDSVVLLVENGVDPQVANDLLARLNRGTSKNDIHQKAAADAFIGSVLTLARGGHLTTVH